jgi:hypothetical protein
MSDLTPPAPSVHKLPARAAAGGDADAAVGSGIWAGRRAVMDDADMRKLVRENDYLKLRCAQLQSEVTDLGGQVIRQRQELERLHGVRNARAEPSWHP